MENPTQQGGATAMHANYKKQRRLGHKREAGWCDANPYRPMAFEPMKLIGKRLKRLQLPHFLGLGAQKGGTTSLQKLLEHHQDVFLPHCKEVQYFSQHSDKPITWYAEHYAKAGMKKRRGDITPSIYSIHGRPKDKKFITNCPNDSFAQGSWREQYHKYSMHVDMVSRIWDCGGFGGRA